MKKKKNIKKGFSFKMPSFTGLSSKFFISLFSICVLFIIILIVGFTAHYRFDTVEVEDNKTGGNIKLVFTTDSNSLTIPNSTPFVDAIGMQSVYNFDFSVETTLKEASRVEYELSLEIDKDLTTVPISDIKVYLEKENSGTYTKTFGPSIFSPLNEDSKLGSRKGTMVIADVKKIKTDTDNYRLRVWQADTSTVSNGVISVVVKVNGIAK